MEDGIACLEVNFDDEIDVGMPVNYIYTSARKYVQKCISSYEDHEEKAREKYTMEDENNYKRRAGHDTMARMNIERILFVKTNGWERKIRINYNIFKSSLHFVMGFSDFLKELAILSEGLMVQIDGVDKSLFLGFLLDSFNLFGDVEEMIDGFRPVRLTPVQRSGLTSQEMLRTLFLLQNPDDRMRLFLSFNVFAISIYHGDRYIGYLLDGLYRKIVAKILFEKKDFDGCLLEGGYRDSLHSGVRLDMKRYMGAKSLLNALYLLFDIFNVDDISLRNILHIVLMFMSKEKGTGLVNFLGLNDLFICAVRSICGDSVPSHLLMMACRDKLNMKYKVGAMKLSIDYVYNWIYKPHLTIMMPRWFLHSRDGRRGVPVLGRPIETVSNKITMELTSDDKEHSNARGPAYSPLSRRLSGGLRDKSPERFRSKQRLDFES
ncbi:uncharacterized protein Eint_090310 [Encephalitozoon intestinalis ATCC 50506]|uniref:Uncharacterized protein n=1 Tax=Encephalitozoon intestinalis (strain ATCC 50506) TaxID=876142 RepID=E0S979_ENCIT|nr:uncharacterized protein Eint_090310 [Encephalitozoon intestinalis ATCC 50506]ADM12161.2 hypothetical protein Eint_090310 [Encephalitozoon intestinalis ATCC 50506]UTX45963.1 hypothetical protein GPK93_09g15480 [Encephalitozoon intestinalis]